MASNRMYRLAEGLGEGLGRTVLHGMTAGVAGGLAFGLVMTVFSPSMLPGIGGIIGFSSLAGGWFYHLFISVVIGGIFGVVLGRAATTYRFGIPWGMVYGCAWWVLGALTLYPLLMGATSNVLVINPPYSWISLAGHLLYGLVTGTVTVWLNKRVANS